MPKTTSERAARHHNRARHGWALALSASTTLGLVAIAAPPAHASPGDWSATGSLAIARDHHTATLMGNGKVLIAGGLVTPVAGQNVVPTASAEVYDPDTGAFSPTCPLALARADHSSTLLPDGRVMVAGGRNGSSALSSVEVYDPEAVDPLAGCTGTWTPTGSLREVRYDHTATTLVNGKVLVASGHGALVLTQRLSETAEVYDPATGTWSLTGSLDTPRENHTATLLGDGSVVVAGGDGIYGNAVPSAERYDPATGNWSRTGSLGIPREAHTATLLGDGSVLVAGGDGIDGSALASAERYDPAAGTWSPTGSLAVRRTAHTATLLPRGTLLVTGGGGSTTELYDPATGNWQSTGSLVAARTDHTATLLPSGLVLAVGGCCPLATAELFKPPATVPGSPTAVTATARNGSATVAWKPPADNGGSPITAYTVTASPGGASVTVDGSATAVTVSGLINRTSYTFTVQATNDVGSGAPSQPSNQVTPTRRPSG